MHHLISGVPIMNTFPLCARTENRLKVRDKSKVPLPQPPPPNPLAHLREPKVRFSIADDSRQLTQNSGGSAYAVPGDTVWKIHAHFLIHFGHTADDCSDGLSQLASECCLHTTGNLKLFSRASEALQKEHVFEHMCVVFAVGSSGSDMVVREFHDALARSPDTAVAVAAIKVTFPVHPAI